MPDTTATPSTASSSDVEAAVKPPNGGEETAAIEKKDEDENLVTWNGPNDPENPQNYSTPYKFFVTGIWIYGNLCATLASSIWSSGSSQIKVQFNQSTIVVTLGISLFLLGFSIGPPLWGPTSERFGRKWPMFTGMLLFTIFTIPIAVGKNIQTLLISRFFQGAFGAAPLSLAAGGVVDIWSPENRGIAIAACIGTIFGSPVLAPIIGNFVAASYLGWRWCHWLSAIMGGSAVLLVFFCLPETLAAKILQARAAKLRKSGEKQDARTIYDSKKHMGLADVARIYFMRPFALLATEPILVLITIYQSFIYGILYLVFVSYPIEYVEIRHWSQGLSALPFLGLSVGVVLGAAGVIWHTKTKFTASVRANGGKVIPEARLPTMIIGGAIVPAGLFIFAWTANPSIPWPGQVIGSIPTGAGMYMIFVQCFNYLIDVYAPIANSALGGNMLIRSSFAAAFPLFWAVSVPQPRGIMGDEYPSLYQHCVNPNSHFLLHIWRPHPLVVKE
ncbi:hypothetical protein NPX13_g813 [Xylaria arbuscula]|uniref:Major facilitator superfamily (MFS) profile domain-containing protein n=1 Tax=Xylaria arbuscula TaxID=114810 RepID=A0A9W8NMT6_9PEZI|nr:hypothetical protein NPX13_g813 [Xylaria arbuscula]